MNNKVIQKIVILLIVSSITAASSAVIKTYNNEIEIKNIYYLLNDIKNSQIRMEDKIDRLKEKTNDK